MVGMLAGCGSDPDAMVDSAKQYMAKNDFKAAAIQLKNALQDSPEHGEARFLLGQISAESGDFASAAKEFERARAVGYAEDRVAPGLALALLRTGQFQKVIDTFSDKRLGDEKAGAGLVAIVGDAQFAIGKVDQAQASYKSALDADPAATRARIGQARILAAQKDLAGARETVEGVLKEDPHNADAHTLLAAVDLAEEKFDLAEAALRSAIQAEPRQAMNHFRLVSLLLRLGKLEDARHALDEMTKITGGNQIYAVYLLAYLNFLEGKDDDAAAAITKVVGAAPDFLPARMLAGSIYLRRRDVNQALQQFGVVLAAQPDNTLAVRLSASAHLLAHDPDRALAALEPVLEKNPGDAALLALAGQAHLAKGDFDAAADEFSKAAEKRPDDPGVRVRLGVSRLGSGEFDQAFTDLNKASQLDESGVQADVAAAMARLRQKNVDEALAAVKRIESKQPDNPLGPNLRGGALLAKGDLKGARESFEKAASLDPSYLPAVVNLARLDLVQKDPKAARLRLEALVRATPKDANAHLALADVLSKSGAEKDEIRKVLENAVKTIPDAQSLHLALSRFLTAQNESREALAVAQRAQATAPEDPAVLAQLGATQIAAGEAEQAVSTLGKLVNLRPNSPQALMMLANAQNAAGNPGVAEQTLLKAYRMAPDSIAAARALVGLRLQLRNYGEALEVAKDVVKRHPKESGGHLLAADIALKRSDWKAAVDALRQAQALDPNSKTLVALHASLTAAGDPQGAEREVGAWLRKNPRDVTVLGYLAESALRAGDFAGARAQYEKMLAATPDNALVLNNIAWTAHQQKDPKAITYAEKALGLAPDSGAILDTVGMIQIASGKKEEGLANLRRAAELMPAALPIQLNLARAYGSTGDPAKAREMLDRLEKEHPDARGLKDEIAKIRAGL